MKTSKDITKVGTLGHKNLLLMALCNLVLCNVLVIASVTPSATAAKIPS